MVFACKKIGVMKRQNWPLVMAGPQDAPSVYLRLTPDLAPAARQLDPRNVTGA